MQNQTQMAAAAEVGAVQVAGASEKLEIYCLFRFSFRTQKEKGRGGGGGKEL